MRICFFNTVKFWGGGEKFYLDYAVGMREMGHEVVIICDKKSILQQRAEAAGIETFNITVSMRSSLNPIKRRRLTQYFKKKSIDFILCSTSQDLKIVSRTATSAGIPKIAFRRGLALPIKKTLLSEHIFRNTITHILANSQETKRLILKNLSHVIPEERIEVIYNGIDTRCKPINFLPEIIKHKKGIVIGNAGRLTPQKGQEDLIKLATALEKKRINFTIFIAGTGEDHEKLQALISAAGLDHKVYLLGFIEDIDRFMQSIDAFVLTSEWEGFGYVMVEAMKYGKPVLAYDISSNPEIIEDHKTGYLIPHGNIEILADRISTLTNDSKLLHELGQAAENSVKNRFDFQESLKRFERWVKS